MIREFTDKEMRGYEIFPDNCESCEYFEEIDVEAIIEEFRECGWNVTEEAIYHNYNAWCNDYKSGYLDEENEYFLFTPCGCNALRFEAMELQPDADWQKTYEA